LTPPYVAVIVTGVDVEAFVESMLKVVEVAPAGTSTDAVGLASIASDVISCTHAPPAGAGASRYTWLVGLDAPPGTDVVERAIELRMAGRTVKVADGDAPP